MDNIKNIDSLFHLKVNNIESKTKTVTEAFIDLTKLKKYNGSESEDVLSVP